MGVYLPIRHICIRSQMMEKDRNIGKSGKWPDVAQVLHK